MLKCSLKQKSHFNSQQRMRLLGVKAFLLTRLFRMLIRMLIIATIISCRSASPGLMCSLWAQLGLVLRAFGALFSLSDRLLSALRLWIDLKREKLSAEPSSAKEVIMTDTLHPESEGEPSELHVRGAREDYHTFTSKGCTLQDFYIKISSWVLI